MDTGHSTGARVLGSHCCSFADSGKFQVVAKHVLRYLGCKDYFLTSTQVFQYFNNSFRWPLCTNWTSSLSTIVFSRTDTEKGRILQILAELLVDPGVEIHSLAFELNVFSTSLSSLLTKVWKYLLFHLFQTKVH